MSSGRCIMDIAKSKSPQALLRDQAMREKRRMNGTCILCGKAPAVAGLSVCYTCRTNNLNRAKERRQALINRGMCASCGRSRAEDGLMCCRACNDKKHEYYLRQKEMKQSLVNGENVE